MYSPAVKAAGQGPGYDPREAERERKKADWMRTAGSMAPAAGGAIGMGIGALAGGLPSAGIGAVPGAAIGGAIGGGIGTVAQGLMGGMADSKTSQYDEADYKQAARLAMVREMMGQMR